MSSGNTASRLVRHYLKAIPKHHHVRRIALSQRVSICPLPGLARHTRSDGNCRCLATAMDEVGSGPHRSLQVSRSILGGRARGRFARARSAYHEGVVGTQPCGQVVSTRARRRCRRRRRSAVRRSGRPRKTGSLPSHIQNGVADRGRRPHRRSAASCREADRSPPI